ncbi:MBL fold metallo-hydrolase [Thiomicrorhabdus sp. Kp2]|uniref:MBL fold metallo-hydrolase n=1 Tax=Thiomicrorhabdus sp. Kp2 TaxID=1123518 RepID=UPI00041526AA|nr:MBL fold metallo-hydrolase [Thiomicrorhabdus sp. Kp2]
MFLFQNTPQSEPGSLSYLLGCISQGLAIAVDVHQNEVELYLELAKSKGLKIAYVIDTHVHADHYTGGYELAQRSNGQYALHTSSPAKCSFTPLIDGQILEAGNVKIEIMHTPGHTEDSITLMVTDRSRTDDPWFLITGHTLFVGSVGRPDLHGREQEMAEQLHNSIYHRILPLPDTMEILPGAQAGSVCGAGISGKPSSTLGFEKRYNPTLRLNREEFIKQVASTALPAPKEIQKILAYNMNPIQKV